MMQQKKKKKSSKGKKIAVTLSEHDISLLQSYVSQSGVTRSIAVRRIIHETLKNYARSLPNPTAHNQLDIFDSMQIDLFNNLSKTED